jgi:hypothetical protein
MHSNNFGLNISSVGILRFLNDIHRKNIYCEKPAQVATETAEAKLHVNQTANVNRWPGLQGQQTTFPTSTVAE